MTNSIPATTPSLSAANPGPAGLPPCPGLLDAVTAAAGSTSAGAPGQGTIDFSRLLPGQAGTLATSEGTAAGAGMRNATSRPINASGLTLRVARVKTSATTDATAASSADATDGAATLGDSLPATGVARDVAETIAALLAPLGLALSGQVPAMSTETSSGISLPQASAQGGPVTLALAGAWLADGKATAATANATGELAASTAEISPGARVAEKLQASAPGSARPAISPGARALPTERDAAISSAAAPDSSAQGRPGGSTSMAMVQIQLPGGSAPLSLSVDLGGQSATPPSASSLIESLANTIAGALAQDGSHSTMGTPGTGSQRSPATRPASDNASVPSITISVQLAPVASGALNSKSLYREAAGPATAANASTAAAEKIAAAPLAAASGQKSGVFGGEKQILDADKQLDTKHKNSDGIGVAKPDANMPATANARRDSVPTNQASPIAARDLAAMSSAAPAPAKASSFSTPVPVLAHRAVETVLNVVTAQNSRPFTASVVNLHFKFGSDDLAVRVQMRDGEVHTQFNTDSAELRSALASEWHASSGQGNNDLLRLVAPTFSSTTASGQGFGSSAQGQPSFQQNPQHAQPSLPANLLGPRSLRPENAAEAAPGSTRAAPALPTSLHLAAVA